MFSLYRSSDPVRPISRDSLIVTAKQKLDLGRDNARRLLHILIENGKMVEVLLPSERRGPKPTGYHRSLFPSLTHQNPRDT
jgi:hypothetical protein